MIAWKRDGMIWRGTELAANGRPLRPCGTRAAAERHASRGEPIDDLCLRARRARDLVRKRVQRAKVRGAQA